MNKTRGAPQAAEMLNQNFRSRWEVLELTNFLCRRTMTRRFGGVDYDEREELRPGEPYPLPGPLPGRGVPAGQKAGRRGGGHARMGGV